uniref:C3H1-type domain-containing protein n=1 Tax=Acrobeloides nanus TaxID=290746 RepID=A0A914C1C1_9BILA
MIVGDHNIPMVNTNSQIFPQDTVTAERTLALLMKNLQINTPSNQQNVMPFPNQQNTMPLSNQMQHKSSLPSISNPLQYINPAVFIQRSGQLPPVLSGAYPTRPSWEDQYKTVMCEANLKGECVYGENCRFAHSDEELRPMKPQPRNSRKYKTKLCEKYTSSGICPYGNNCFFIHPDNPIKQDVFDLCYRISQIDPQFSLNELDGSYPMKNRIDFSASVPVGTRFQYESLNSIAQNGFLPRLNGLRDSSNTIPYSPSYVSSISERVPSLSSTAPSTSSTSDTVHSHPLKQQVMERLRERNDFECLPPEEQLPKKSQYNPFTGGIDLSSHFSSSFAGFK